MHQAQVTAWGQTPKYVSAPDLPAPSANETRIKILAVGAHQVVQSRAAGRHYSSGNPPHVPGTDGVGVTSESNKIVYFSDWANGTFREYANIATDSLTPLPEGLEATQVAGLLNPASSSWMALKTRTKLPEPGFTVLILGATSVSGRIAIQLARSLGGERVIGVARNEATLQSLEGLDEFIVANTDEIEKTDFSSLGDVDVILDYFYGPLTAHLFESLEPTRPVQYVEVGVLAGQPEIALPGAVLRSKDITIRGSGKGAWSVKELEAEVPDLLEKIKGLSPLPVRVVKLEDVEKEWANASKERLVFVP